MIALLPQNAIDLAAVGEFAAKNLSVPMVLLGFLFYGGKAFMTLAQKFSTDVVAELKEIKNAISGQEIRVEALSAKIDSVHGEVAGQATRIERLNELVAGSQCKQAG